MNFELPVEVKNLWSDSKVQNQNPNETDYSVETNEMTFKEKLRAAYALNLCTVSISRILNNRDQYVMDQEYDAILNNLNLQNLPNDPSLLKILKEILNVITFFKIQEGDKAFIEEDYKQALKKNMTSAVNISALIGSVSNIGRNFANPVAWVSAGVSIATTVGVGYMNYRSGKSQARLEKQKKEWELQRSAIEQLNGLRRELLDTAWHLTKNYDIDDFYRLTENQISKYLDILKDEDDIRRLMRLEFIKDSFYAYPPFWYQLGHTARLVALSENEGKEYYESYAKQCFEFFNKTTEENLLRDDQIAASCALEYVELLDPQKEKNEIIELLDKALKHAGSKNDVLQLCAVGYLRIECLEKAIPLLWHLVNDKYEEEFNAELLSIVFCKQYVSLLTEGKFDEAPISLDSYLCPCTEKLDELDDRKRIIRYGYDLLWDRTTEKDYLMPFPEDNCVTTVEGYWNQRKELLKEKVEDVVNQICLKYAKELLSVVLPEDAVSRYDELLEDNNGLNEQKWFSDCIQVATRKNGFIESLKEKNILLDTFYVYESMYDCFARFLELFAKNNVEAKDQIKEMIEDFWEKNRDSIERVKTITNETDDGKVPIIITDCWSIFSIKELMGIITPIVTASFTQRIKDPNEVIFEDDAEHSKEMISELELNLFTFSKEYDFKIPVIHRHGANVVNNRTTSKHSLDARLIGIESIETYEAEEKANRERTRILISLFEKYRDEIIEDTEKLSLKIRTDAHYDSYIKGKAEFSNKPIAVLVPNKNNRGRKYTISFAEDGLFWVDKRIGVSYEDVGFGNENALLLKGKPYNYKGINYSALRTLIESIKPIVNKSVDFDPRQFIDKSQIAKKVEQKIQLYTASAAAVNATNIIPFASFAPLFGIQVAMLLSIAKVYMIDADKKTIEEIVKSTLEKSAIISGGDAIFKTLASIIPGAHFVSGAISASVAGSMTYSMGTAFSEYCKSLISNTKTCDGKAERSTINKDDAINMMKPVFDSTIVEKEDELKKEEDRLSLLETKMIAEVHQEIEDVNKGYQNTAAVIAHGYEAMEKSNREVSTGLQGWDGIKERINGGNCDEQ